MHYRMIYKVALVSFWMVIQAAADGKIKTLRLVEEPAVSEASTSQEKATMSVALTVVTVPGNEYQLQATGNLVSGIWDDIGAVITATQSVTSGSFPESDAYRYFRVIVVKKNVVPTLPLPPSSPPPPPPPPM